METINPQAEATVLRSMHLITYGCGNSFDRSKFKKIQNRNYVKPIGGLWASPVGCNYGWKEWCEEETWGDLLTSFEFMFRGKVLIIDSFDDLSKMPWRSAIYNDLFKYPDYEVIASSGVDAIHLTEKGQDETRFCDPSLYGWDCECVLVINPDCII